MSCIYCAGSPGTVGPGACAACGESAGVLVAEHGSPDALAAAARRELGHRFQIDTVAAHGSRSTVFAARELDTGRRLALRVLGRPLLRDPQLVVRVRRAIAAAALDHPHIVPINRFGTTDSLVWYTMPIVEGPSLAAQLAATGPLALDACLRIVRAVGGALDHAHGHQLIHGDIRPASVLFGAQGRVLVTDCVLGSLLDNVPGLGPGRGAHPPYAAPELAAGEPPSVLSDQYALAVTIHECLTGAPPDPAGRRPALPAPVWVALERALRARPGDRFRSVPDLVSALSPLAAGPTAPRHPRGPRSPQPVLLLDELPRGRHWVGFTLVAALAGAGGLAMAGRSDPPPAPPPLSLEPPKPVPVSAALAALPPVEPYRERLPLAAPPAPPVHPKPTPATRPATRPANAAPPAPGHLYISSRPWGRIYVDGAFVGNTPQADLPVAAGVHLVRVVREGYEPFEQQVGLAPGQVIRLVDLVLPEQRR